MHNTDPDFPHRSCKISPLLSNMLSQREDWVLGTSTLIFHNSTEETYFYGGG